MFRYKPNTNNYVRPAIVISRAKNQKISFAISSFILEIFIPNTVVYTTHLQMTIRQNAAAE